MAGGLGVRLVRWSSVVEVRAVAEHMDQLMKCSRGVFFFSKHGKRKRHNSTLNVFQNFHHGHQEFVKYFARVRARMLN